MENSYNSLLLGERKEEEQIERETQKQKVEEMVKQAQQEKAGPNADEKRIETADVNSHRTILQGGLEPNNLGDLLVSITLKDVCKKILAITKPVIIITDPLRSHDREQKGPTTISGSQEGVS